MRKINIRLRSVETFRGDGWIQELTAIWKKFIILKKQMYFFVEIFV